MSQKMAYTPGCVCSTAQATLRIAVHEDLNHNILAGVYRANGFPSNGLFQPTSDFSLLSWLTSQAEASVLLQSVLGHDTALCVRLYTGDLRRQCATAALVCLRCLTTLPDLPMICTCVQAEAIPWLRHTQPSADALSSSGRVPWTCTRGYSCLVMPAVF